MTTKSQALQVIAAATMSAASAFAGSRVQKAFDSEELEGMQRALEFVGEQCHSEQPTHPTTIIPFGDKLPPRPDTSK